MLQCYSNKVVISTNTTFTKGYCMAVKSLQDKKAQYCDNGHGLKYKTTLLTGFKDFLIKFPLSH